MVHPPYKQQQGDIRGDCRSGYGMFVSSLYLMFFWSNIRSGQARWVREGQCVVHSFFANFCLLWTFLVWRVTTSKEFYNLLPCQAAATFCWWAEVLPQVHHIGRERRVVNFGTWRWCCCCRSWWRCWGDRTTWDLGWRATSLIHLFSSFWWNLFCAFTMLLIFCFHIFNWIFVLLKSTSFFPLLKYTSPPLLLLLLLLLLLKDQGGLNGLPLPPPTKPKQSKRVAEKVDRGTTSRSSAHWCQQLGRLLHKNCSW